MLYLYIFLVTLILAIIYMRFEAGLLKVERVKLTKSKNSLKMLHLSDIHIRRIKVSWERIRQVIHHEKPDLLILTGDYIEKSNEADKFLTFLDYVLGEQETYLCLGNHDYEAFKDDAEGLNDFIAAIDAKGVTVLDNHSACFEKDGKKYNIVGIGDIKYACHDIELALASCYQDAFMHIGISHNPDIVLQIPRGKIDYLFSGHFHGGQIWAPFNLEFKLLRKRDILSKKGIKRGLHKVNTINLYISRGLGNVSLPLRFLSRPEITVLYLP